MFQKLTDLDEDIQEILTRSYIQQDVNRYRKQFQPLDIKGDKGKTLFESFLSNATMKDQEEAKYKVSKVIWGTDNYESLGSSYKFNKPVNDLSVIFPRVEKAKEVQKKRVKEKAEVFTPTWVCNLQNNLIDDHLIREGAFNTVDVENQKVWIPSESPVFEDDEKALEYILQDRLEATCGEGPYLMSPYDPTNGEIIPVRDKKGRFQRIGILDRKLRVVTESCDDSVWVKASLLALQHTFGYEWQGDNLILARLNFFNTFVEYYFDKFNETLGKELLLEVSEITSWQLWQMDGLKSVIPESCSKDCKKCLKGRKEYFNHEGKVPVMRFNNRVIPFENIIKNNIDK